MLAAFAHLLGSFPVSFYFSFSFSLFVSFHQLAHWIIQLTEAEEEAEAEPLSGAPHGLPSVSRPNHVRVTSHTVQESGPASGYCDDVI